tara:strand:+ start:69 stop:431 length:363 start_codon:yes stop_codon:yes gene_type:complete
MYEKITPANWLMFAMHNYDNPQCESEEEFLDDVKRFKYLKRLFKKYQETGELKERLILNHIIVLSNVFGIEASGILLFFKIDRDYWPALKTFMIYLHMIPETEMQQVEMDPKVWEALENI